MRLLIVEDSPLDAELTVRQLEADGIKCTWDRVATETDFRAALQSAPDLIISDCTLPGFSGLAAFSIAAAEAPAIPFVFISGTLEEGHARQVLEAGAAAVIWKGDRTHLCATVKSALDVTARPCRRAADRRSPAFNFDRSPAEHLLARRSVLDASLRNQPRTYREVVSKSAPTPVAILVLSDPTARERFSRLLALANLEADIPFDAGEALADFAAHTQPLLFTDDLALIRSVRQLPSGAAPHIVFVGLMDEGNESDALRAGASDCMSSTGRGKVFWAHLMIARRFAGLTVSLELALHENSRLSAVDELTGAGRRAFFEEQFPREVARAVSLGRPLGLAMCDIDHFKRVNDRYGHPVGDLVLQEFAARIAGSLRVGKDWLARLGGEEFAIVFPDTPAAEVFAVAERLRRRIQSEIFQLASTGIRVKASFGVCALDIVPRGDGFGPRMLRAADAALYESKRRGRNRVTLWDAANEDLPGVTSYNHRAPS
jgi:diguanylate cyclase (GGDEF)-like protein